MVRGEYVNVSFDLDVHCLIRVHTEPPLPVELA